MGITRGIFGLGYRSVNGAAPFARVLDAIVAGKAPVDQIRGGNLL
jgi:hypothetical protein